VDRARVAILRAYARTLVPIQPQVSLPIRV
jgi:hypothetical protein